MENQPISQPKQKVSHKFSKKLLLLTVAGGAAFWAATILTSILPVAASYRAAFSNWSIQTVWVASLPMGLVIGCCVSFLLLKLTAKKPIVKPLLKAIIISAIVLIAAVLLIDVPMFLKTPNGSLHYFFVGVLFNTARFLILGATIGFLYKGFLLSRDNQK
ncbi:hypothetical protein SDC9_47730 [bioreactor metagenome]|uniref:Uncharacterized protein n=1 Tax=bioreactor metagenome TaxID=1076179 RepID=A0A644WCG5_9ZZZZ